MYIFRADGNARIGAGHIMRMLTIADALSTLLDGVGDIVFVCADDESATVASNRGYKTYTLGTDYQDMESEIDNCSYLLKDIRGSERVDVNDMSTGKQSDNNVIIVDSYNVTNDYLNNLREYGKVFYMDDMQEHTYPVDGVINYNAYADKNIYVNLYSEDVIKLIGLDYMPLRSQFVDRDYDVKDEVRNVLITTGGGDVDNIAGQIINAVNSDAAMHYHVVSGQFNPHMEELELQAKSMGNVTIHKNVQDMAGLMLGCDFAITAGGGTMNELCALGVPFMCFTYADNQEPGAEYMLKHNIADYAGAYHRDSQVVIKSIADIFTININDSERRINHSNKGRGLIDGKGAGRIAETLRKCK